VDSSTSDFLYHLPAAVVDVACLPAVDARRYQYCLFSKHSSLLVSFVDGMLQVLLLPSPCELSRARDLAAAGACTAGIFPYHTLFALLL